MFVAAHEAMSHFYAPGHSARELDRLSPQARMYEPFTRQLFRETGLLPGCPFGKAAQNRDQWLERLCSGVGR